MKKSLEERKRIKEKLNFLRGQIISEATEVEIALGWRLRKYFFPRTNNQSTAFYWYIINTPNFGFDKKISLYQQIPYFKKLRNYSKVMNSLRFIQKLRNAVAHWTLEESKSNENDIFIYALVPKYQEMKLNEELLKKFNEHKNYIFIVFNWRWPLENAAFM